MGSKTPEDAAGMQKKSQHRRHSPTLEKALGHVPSLAYGVLGRSPCHQCNAMRYNAIQYNTDPPHKAGAAMPSMQCNAIQCSSQQYTQECRKPSSQQIYQRVQKANLTRIHQRLQKAKLTLFYQYTTEGIEHPKVKKPTKK